MVRIGERHMCCVEGIAGVPMWHAEGRESYVVRRGEGRLKRGRAGVYGAQRVEGIAGVCGAQRGEGIKGICGVQRGEQRCAEGRGSSRHM